MSRQLWRIAYEKHIDYSVLELVHYTRSHIKVYAITALGQFLENKHFRSQNKAFEYMKQYRSRRYNFSIYYKNLDRTVYARFSRSDFLKFNNYQEITQFILKNYSEAGVYYVSDF